MDTPQYYKNMALLDAVALQDVLVVKALLQDGADPNFFADDAKVSPLHIAAQRESVDILFLLLEAGGNPDAETEDGESVLDVAKLHGHPKILELLFYYVRD